MGTFDTNSNPALFLERQGGDGSPQRLPAGSTALVRVHPSGDPLPSTTTLALGYLSFTTDADAIKVSGDNGASWKGPFYSDELRDAAFTGAGAGSDLLDPDTGQIKAEYIPSSITVSGNYAALDPDTGLIDAAVIPDLSGSYDTAGAAEAVQSDLDAFKPQTASNEDLLFVWSNGGQYGETMSSGGDFVIMAAPMDATILSVSLVWDDSSGFSGIAASDTNYWALEVLLNNVSVATRSTQATGTNANGSIATEQDWNFDGAVWSARNLNKGQVLKLRLGKTGTPAALGSEFSVSVRYQRQATV